MPLQSGQSLEQMPKINIAVGSKRGPKINAVKQALEVFSPYFPPGTEAGLRAAVSRRLDFSIQPEPPDFV